MERAEIEAPGNARLDRMQPKDLAPQHVAQWRADRTPWIIRRQRSLRVVRPLPEPCGCFRTGARRGDENGLRAVVTACDPNEEKEELTMATKHLDSISQTSVDAAYAEASAAHARRAYYLSSLGHPPPPSTPTRRAVLRSASPSRCTAMCVGRSWAIARSRAAR